MSASNNAPVIIKRKKVISGGGHHGGAWKVAYADFVTAMMAFFMLMWLLNATTEKQRKGIADYFHPTIPVNRISGGGDGAFGGNSVFSENTMAQNGTGASGRHTTANKQAVGASGLSPTGAEEQVQKMQAMQEELEKALTARSGESMVSDGTMRHIVTRVTDEGLIVELFDLNDSRLFLDGTDTPTPEMEALTSIIAEVFALVENAIAVGGHTRAHAGPLVQDPSWNLSTRRAHAVRQLLEGDGIVARRVQRVTGFADRKLVAPDPTARRNNRIEVVLLRSEGPTGKSSAF
ncbi:flagellar motor protein MotB [Actibacterium lipolyticum]|uniref:Chemotaxis protein LafU n=1 Tax=Actibacterium lipolyticum TaxID=1524263 RepID=A0A238KYG4_9RHOB|nr:flagellar motor protein MotB [Actibacterium lipolyticum]SMX47242.1 Chemotaxis protein LafU [Actibacterium lipolyticum]